MGSVDVDGRGVLVPVRGGMFGRGGGVPMYCARRLRRSGVPLPGVLGREPTPLRLLGVPKPGACWERGLTMLRGLVGLVIGVWWQRSEESVSFERE